MVFVGLVAVLPVITPDIGFSLALVAFLARHDTMDHGRVCCLTGHVCTSDTKPSLDGVLLAANSGMGNVGRRAGVFIADSQNLLHCHAALYGIGRFCADTWRSGFH